MSPLCFQGRSSESVRDVQFACPTYNYFAFGTASESGIVEVRLRYRLNASYGWIDDCLLMGGALQCFVVL